MMMKFAHLNFEDKPAELIKTSMVGEDQKKEANFYVPLQGMDEEKESCSNGNSMKETAVDHHPRRTPTLSMPVPLAHTPPDDQLILQELPDLPPEDVDLLTDLFSDDMSPTYF